MENSRNIEYVVLKENADIPWHLAVYLRSTRCSLYDAYKRPSEAKQAAWKRCEEIRAAYGGQEPKICSYNSQKFTYGFIAGVIPFFNGWNAPDWLLERSMVLVYITSSKETRFLVPIDLMNRAVNAAKRYNPNVHRF